RLLGRVRGCRLGLLEVTNALLLERIPRAERNDRRIGEDAPPAGGVDTLEANGVRPGRPMHRATSEIRIAAERERERLRQEDARATAHSFEEIVEHLAVRDSRHGW